MNWTLVLIAIVLQNLGVATALFSVGYDVVYIETSSYGRLNHLKTVFIAACLMTLAGTVCGIIATPCF